MTYIASTLKPHGNYPTHDSEFGLGGYREVECLGDLNKIPTERLKIGSLVYVAENDTIYKWNGTEFVATELLVTTEQIIDELKETEVISQHTLFKNLYSLNKIEERDKPTPENLNGWTSQYPTEQSGKYVWVAFVYKNNTGQYVKPETWTYARLTGKDGKNGEDGETTEYIYKLTQSNSRPDTPSSKQQRDYIPIGWTDNPTGISEQYKYEWMCLRLRTTNGWGNFTDPVLWAKWGDKGTDGDGVEYIFSTMYDPSLTSNRPLRAAGVTTQITEEESTTSEISDTEPISPVVISLWNPANWAASQLDDYLGPSIIAEYRGGVWKDNPSTDSDKTIEYVSLRKKKNGLWQQFCEPAIWYKAGSNISSEMATQVLLEHADDLVAAIQDKGELAELVLEGDTAILRAGTDGAIETSGGQVLIEPHATTILNTTLNKMGSQLTTAGAAFLTDKHGAGASLQAIYEHTVNDSDPVVASITAIATETASQIVLDALDIYVNGEMHGQNAEFVGDVVATKFSTKVKETNGLDLVLGTTLLDVILDENDNPIEYGGRLSFNKTSGEEVAFFAIDPEDDIFKLFVWVNVNGDRKLKKIRFDLEHEDSDLVWETVGQPSITYQKIDLYKIKDNIQTHSHGAQSINDDNLLFTHIVSYKTTKTEGGQENTYYYKDKVLGVNSTKMDEGFYLYKVKDKKLAFVRLGGGETWCDYPYPIVEYGFLYIDSNGIGTLETNHIILGLDYRFEPKNNGSYLAIASDGKLATLSFNRIQKNTNAPYRIVLVSSNNSNRIWLNILTYDGMCYVDPKLGNESYFYYIDGCSTNSIELYDTAIQPIKLTYHNGELDAQNIQFSSDDNY